eukprot:gene4944-8541_t
MSIENQGSTYYSDYEKCKVIFKESHKNYKKLDELGICSMIIQNKFDDEKGLHNDENLTQSVVNNLKGKGDCITSSIFVEDLLKKQNLKFSWATGYLQPENEFHCFLVVFVDVNANSGMILMDATRGDNITEPLFLLKSEGASIYVPKAKLQFSFINQKIFQVDGCNYKGSYSLDDNSSSALEQLRKSFEEISNTTITRNKVTQKLSEIKIPTLPNIENILKKISNALNEEEMIIISKKSLEEELKQKKLEVDILKTIKEDYDSVSKFMDKNK